MGVKNIASNIFYVFHHLSRCEVPKYKWMETLLQGRKADATNRSVGFSDSLNGNSPTVLSDRCFCIGHFRDHSTSAPGLPAISNEIGLGLRVVGLPKARRDSIKLSEKTQESFREDIAAMFLRQSHISSTKCEDRWISALLQ